MLSALVALSTSFALSAAPPAAETPPEAPPSPLASTTTTTPAATTTTTERPNWSLGVGLDRGLILVVGPGLFPQAGVGVERRLTDTVWMTFDAHGGVGAYDDKVDVVSGVAGGGDVGARWFFVDDGVVRPSLRASTGLNVSGQSAADVAQLSWQANVTGGVDVDVFVHDAVSLRVGTELAHAAFQRDEPSDVSLGADTFDVGVGLSPALSLRVFF